MTGFATGTNLCLSQSCQRIKMAFSWKHVVPWTNRSEFVRVYEDLYSNDIHRRKSAVDEIAVWKSRSMHKLSVAIECSAALTDAFLRHHHAQQTNSVNENDHSLRAMFSLALIRFVNHITEKGQNKPFAQPVHRIAQEFGIPEWIVRLRHDATHGSLPCLDVLTTGAQWALSYLQDVFWSHQIKDSAADEEESSNRQSSSGSKKDATGDFHDILHSYQKSSYRSLEDGPESESAREEGRALRQLESILSGQRRNHLLACLVEPGHLPSSEEQLHTYKVNLKETLQADPPKLPSILVNIWRSLLRLLQSRQLTGLLLQHMLKSLLSRSDVTSLHNRMLAAWLRFILLFETSNFEKSEKERASLPELYRSSIEINKNLLLATCLQTPTVWSCTLLSLLGDPGSLPSETRNKLEELEKIYHSREKTGSKSTEETEEAMDEADKEINPGKIFSVADLKEIQSHPVEPEDEGNIWQLCTEPVDWDRVAWGLVPGHTLADTCLDCGSDEGEEIMLEEEMMRSTTDDQKGSPSHNHGVTNGEGAEKTTWTGGQSSPLMNKIEVS